MFGRSISIWVAWEVGELMKLRNDVVVLLFSDSVSLAFHAFDLCSVGI